MTVHRASEFISFPRPFTFRILDSPSNKGLTSLFKTGERFVAVIVAIAALDQIGASLPRVSNA